MSHDSKKSATGRKLRLGGVQKFGEPADLAAGAFGGNDTLAGGFADGRDSLAQSIIESFGIAGHGFAESTHGVFDFGTTGTVTFGMRCGLTNAFHG